MIDIDSFKIGSEVWIVHNNRPYSFVSHHIHKLSSQVNIAGGGFSIPADHCFLAEMDLINAQCQYWQELKAITVHKEATDFSKKFTDNHSDMLNRLSNK